MSRLTEAQIAQYLAGPYQAVLSVNRDMRGPLAVPMSYLFEEGRFLIVTASDSLHGRLMRSTGRATLTIHAEEYPPGRLRQWYVTAEGPVVFTSRDPAPVVRAIIAKDRPPDDAEAWSERAVATMTQLAVLTPTSLDGHVFESSLER